METCSRIYYFATKFSPASAKNVALGTLLVLRSVSPCIWSEEIFQFATFYKAIFLGAKNVAKRRRKKTRIATYFVSTGLENVAIGLHKSKKCSSRGRKCSRKREKCSK